MFLLLVFLKFLKSYRHCVLKISSDVVGGLMSPVQSPAAVLL
jgi:hypothetical protein